NTISKHDWSSDVCSYDLSFYSLSFAFQLIHLAYLDVLKDLTLKKLHPLIRYRGHLPKHEQDRLFVAYLLIIDWDIDLYKEEDWHYLMPLLLFSGVLFYRFVVLLIVILNFLKSSDGGIDQSFERPYYLFATNFT